MLLMTELLLSFLSGCLLTGILVYLWQKSLILQRSGIIEEQLRQQSITITELNKSNRELQQDNTLLVSQLTRSDGKLEALEVQCAGYNSLQLEHLEAQKALASLKQDLNHAEEKLHHQKEELTALNDQLRFEFSNMAQRILDEKTEKFTQVNEAKMKAILDPLKTEIGAFKQKVEETYDKESKERFSLGREVEKLIQMSQQVSQEANNLTTALKGNNKVQGNWGEMILESLLEHSGFTKGREYFAQQFITDNAGNIIKDEHGKGLQPDITICYPDGRKVIIDSKVSLLAWDECIAQETKEEQLRCLKEHITSIRQHIDGLNRKNYPKYALALDYVLLFIPIEPAFLEAVKTDTHLWKHAYDKKILLVSPTNLFAVLKIIADLWKVETQNRNALNIADKAGSLYDKFCGFVENLQEVGRKINDANVAYEAAFKQLSTGRGNILNKVEELKKMGANASKQLSEKVIMLEE
jgi:DNA recombination protein RmuC